MSTSLHSNSAQVKGSGVFARYALALLEAGLGEVFPIRQDTKKPRAWLKPKFTFDGESEDRKYHTVTGRYHEPITRERVEEWAEMYPDDLIGLIPAPGTVVTDLDQHDDKHGAEKLAKALGIKGRELAFLLRGTLHVSGREAGGKWEALHGHWYFTVEPYEDGTYPELVRTHPDVPGLEVIGPGRQGFYVIGPGSIHVETGKVYQADVSGVPVPVEGLSRDLARPMPAPLLDLLTMPEKRATAVRTRPIGAGLVEDAMRYANDPHSEPDEAVAEVLAEFIEHPDCYGGKTTHHDSAMAVQLDLVHLAEEGHPGVWTALSEAEAVAEPYFEAEGRGGEWERSLSGVLVDIERMKTGQETGDWSYAPPVTTLDPAIVQGYKSRTDAEAVWVSRKVFRRLRDFARARRVSPWALLGCVLAIVAASVGPEVVLPPLVGSDGSLNLFVAVCGDSGSGKSAAMSAAEDFLQVIGGLNYLTTSPGSGEGLLTAYVRYVPPVKGTKDAEGVPAHWEQYNRSALYFADEVQGLGALTGRTNSTLQPFLKTGWVGRLLATQNSSGETTRRVEPHAYRLVLVAGVQPEHAEVIFADIGGGFPQRWVWVPTNDPGRPARDIVVDEPAPYVWDVPEVGVVGVNGRHRIEVCNSVREAVYAAQEATNRPIGSKAPGDTLDGHAVFAREKVAALLMLLDGRAGKITGEDWRLSGLIMAKSNETRDAVFKAHTEEQAREADRRAKRAGRSACITKETEAEHGTVRTMRKLRERLAKDGGWVTRANLRRSLSASSRDYFEDAMDRLCDQREVETREVSSGQAGTEYRLVES